MSDKFVAYLTREHERLEQELSEAMRERCPDQFRIARLKKLKLAVRDQIAANEQTIHMECIA